MPQARLIEPFGQRLGPKIEAEAQALARVLPRLALEARRVSAQVALGIHGRRRAGPGETFWQFRPFMSGEPADRIDWRRSARDDRLYVREREWESASTYWIWIDLSASMHFASSLAMASKRDRAIVLALAMADLLVRGGERVGLLGLTAPIVTRNIIGRLSDALALSAAGLQSDMPDGPPPGPRDRVILIGDMIVDSEDFTGRFEKLTARGAGGTLVQLRDPVETLFPFAGETEFLGPEDGSRWIVGDPRAMADAYKLRLETHEAHLRTACQRRGWTFRPMLTAGPASEALMHLAMAVTNGAATRSGAA